MALMKCPICGGDSRCYASRPARDGAVRRHRVCKACGESFTTYEQVVRQVVEQVTAERMLSLLDTARRLGISKTSAYNQVVAGHIPAWRSGGRIWISEAWVNQALANRERDWTLAADHV